MLDAKTANRLKDCLAEKKAQQEMIKLINTPGTPSLDLQRRLTLVFGKPTAAEIIAILESGSGTLSAKAEKHMIVGMARKAEALELEAAINNHSA